MKLRALLAPCVLVSALASSSLANAKATLMVVSADDPGEGFNDTTTASAVGGNKGKTRGEQRMIAVQHAADLWGEVLDSDVPIVIRATFDVLGCGATGGTAVLAQASAAGVHIGVTGDGADPDLLYPRALAESLEHRELMAGEPDIEAFFNTSIDDPSCLGGLGWYYGLDAKGGDKPDLTNTALHELGHGLGVGEFADIDTGALFQGVVDVYATHVYDAKIGKRWDQMSNAERVTSATNVRRVAWDGAQTTAAAAKFLAPGLPKIVTSPTIAGLSGIVADASFGVIPSGTPVHGPLAIGNPLDGCSMNSSVAGKIVLLAPACKYSAVAGLLEQAGALGTLMAIGVGGTSPPYPLEERAPATVNIPVMSISDDDLMLLSNAVNAGAVNADLSADKNLLLGADDKGRVLLNVTQPISASSISHFDTLARPNLLMEPIATREQPNDVDLTAAMLHDLGWAPFCGNGRVERDEACDDGSKNSDTTADACRADCSKARCGDGVTDKAEGCDDGTKNSDRKANACRSDCSSARCGDSVVDNGEACDSGDKNSDTTADACRKDCSMARCGDGVKDRSESCDDGDNNSDTSADACRKDCKAARCGDGVTDKNEACDDGDKNSDSSADACRKDCKAARCGDGVTDKNEACDDGDKNSDSSADACRKDCKAARCGDGVKDQGEDCDDESDSCNACKRPTSKPGSSTGTNSGSGGNTSKDTDAGPNANESDLGDKKGVSASCHCDTVGGRRDSRLATLALGCCAIAAWRLRRRARFGSTSGFR